MACGVSFLRVGPGGVIQGTFGRFGRLQIVLMVFLSLALARRTCDHRVQTIKGLGFCEVLDLNLRFG